MTSIEFEFEGKKVTARSEKDWTWGGYQRKSVNDLSPEKRKDIDSLVKKKFVEQEKARTVRELTEHKAFKTMVADANKTGIATEFQYNESDPDCGKIKEVTLFKTDCKKQTVSATISWDDRVYRPDTFRGSKTDKPWCLSWNYKTIRYKLFNTAFTKTVERIEQKVKDNEAGYKHAVEISSRDDKINARLEQLGLTLDSEIGRGSRVCYKVGKVLKSTKHGVYSWSDTVEIWGDINYIDKGKLIEEHTITKFQLKGKMTVDNFSKLTKFLSQMTEDNEIEVN